MRWLLAIFAVLVALWCGWWWAGSTLIAREARGFLAQQAAEGRVTGTPEVSVAGFPSRFDLTIEPLALRDPASGAGYAAPFVQIFAMTWKPWHIIAALPPTQVLTLPDGQGVTLTGTDLKASLRAAPALDLPLAEARLAGRALSAASDAGWTLGAESLALALRQADGPADYALGLEATRIAPDPALIAALAAATPPSDLPAVIDRLHADATLTLSAPLDRHAGQARPRLLALDLRGAGLDWGALSISAAGRIAPDDRGFAAGRIEIAIRGRDRLPALLVALGLVKPEIAPTIARVLDSAAAAGADPEVLTLPLLLQDGWISLGPLPLGPAPLLTAPPA